MLKKELTKQPNVYYNGSTTIVKHCKNIIAINEDGNIYVHCRKCKQWVKVNNLNKQLM